MPPEIETNLVWMDLEMSGLDPKTCVILGNRHPDHG